jgi:transcriptional regulator GlxA family with amidase domain
MGGHKYSEEIPMRITIPLVVLVAVLVGPSAFAGEIDWTGRIHLTEKLSGDEVARQCGLSVRHLNRLFAGEQTSLMHYVWERRLVRCHCALFDPVLRHRAISDIAFAAGFNDLAHFSRAYRARYGMSPRAARTKADGVLRGEPP